MKCYISTHRRASWVIDNGSSTVEETEEQEVTMEEGRRRRSKGGTGRNIYQMYRRGRRAEAKTKKRKKKKRRKDEDEQQKAQPRVPGGAQMFIPVDLFPQHSSGPSSWSLECPLHLRFLQRSAPSAIRSSGALERCIYTLCVLFWPGCTGTVASQPSLRYDDVEHDNGIYCCRVRTVCVALESVTGRGMVDGTR